MKGSIRQLLRAITYTSFTFLVLQVAFQIAFYYLLPNGSRWEVLLCHFGLLRLSRVDAGNIFRLLVPDIGMFFSSIVATRLYSKLGNAQNCKMQLCSEDEEQNEEEGYETETEDSYEEESSSEDNSGKKAGFKKPAFVQKAIVFLAGLKSIIDVMLRHAGKVVATLLLGVAGIIFPSATSATYFFTFLGLCSWWSCHLPIALVTFSSLCVMMAIFSAGHLTALYLYQLPYFQDLIPPDDIYARLLGMTAIIKTNITESWKLQLHPGLTWPVFLNPLVLLVLYYALVVLLQQWALNPMEHREEDVHLPPAEHNSLELETMSWVAKNEENKVNYFSSGNGQDTACLYCEQDTGCEIPAHKHEGLTPPLSEDHDSPETTDSDGNRTSTLAVLGQFILNQSYTSALIAMMVRYRTERIYPVHSTNFLLCATVTREFGMKCLMWEEIYLLEAQTHVWSITHLSWLTFVLLIWACIIWMARDRRLYAMYSSPFLVTYGNILLVLSFFVGLNISQEEVFPGISTSVLIDFDLKPYSLPCLHLAAKISYAFTFWLLLKQHIIERRSKEKQDPLKEVAVNETEGNKPNNFLLELFGSLLKGILVKYWIYFCTAMFFVVSFSGKVVVYKILYVLLFLLCVTLYQIHYEWWRRILKGFWLAVVSYSMVVLIVVYVFQFQSTSGFLLLTLAVSEERLKDLGLEKFDTVELFAKILLPSAFLLACILQLHYFHKDFLKITDLRNVPGDAFTLGSKKKTETNVHLLADMLKESIVKLQKGVAANEPPGETQTSLDKTGNATVDEDAMREGQSEKSGERTSNWTLVIDKSASCLLKLLEMVREIQVLGWRILELHILKIVSIWIIWISLEEVSMMSYPFFILWVFALPYPKLRPHASRICTIWSSVMVICRMMYQLKFVKPHEYSSNCTERLYQNGTYYHDNRDELLQKSVLYVAPVDPAVWYGGFRKCDDSVLPCLKNHLTILGLMAMEVTVHRHQLFYRTQNQLIPPITGSIFESVTREHLDDGLLSCIKYFFNYGFYKFGLEMCLLAAVNVIMCRMDFFAFIHACWLIYLLWLHRRKAMAEVWPRYCCFLACILAFQYLLCIGFPPAFCKDYPWRTSRWSVHSNFIKWLYLPDFAKRPEATFLLYDFLLLLLASLQCQVFEDENKVRVRMQAGDNMEISYELDPAALNQYSPVPNFVRCRSYLDMAKMVVFSYHFWFVLCLIFITGTTQISIFCIGYLVACFYFMLFGSNLLLEPVKNILRPWDYLIAYTVLVIAMKNFLAIGACAYLEKLLGNHCWLIHTFGMFCTIPGYDLEIPEDETCELPENKAGIFWDAISFTFLLVQRRVFTSYYYLYVVADLKAANILAFRGAELFEAKLKKLVLFRLKEEEESVQVMGRQMELIRSKQKKGDRLKERIPSPEKATVKPSAEDQELLDTEGGQKKEDEDKKWWQPWVTHTSVIQAGSYYLFETDSEDEEEEGDTEQRKEEESKRKTAFQLAHEAWMTNSKSALRTREQDEIREQRKKEQLGDMKGASFEEETEQSMTEEPLDEPEDIIQRVINIVKLAWVLVQVLLDDIIEAVNSLCKDNLDIAKVLRIERCILWREINRGKEASADTVLQYYNLKKNQQVQRSACEGNKVETAKEDQSEEDILSEYQQIRGQDIKQPYESMASREPEEAAEETNGDESGEKEENEDSIKGTEPETTTCPASCVVLANLGSRSLETEDYVTSPSIQKTKVAGRLLNEVPVMTASDLLLNRMFHDNELEQSDKFYERLPRLLKLGFALYNAMVSKSEILCYFVIILNHMVSASVLTLVLPILVFMWAMLSIPRPTKFFWVIAIIYTQITVAVKYFSQFGFFPWTSKLYCALHGEEPFALPNIVGIEKKDGYVHFDLVQLLALFFHRSILKCHGLWDAKGTDVPDPKKTMLTWRQKKKQSRVDLEESEDESGTWHLFRHHHLSKTAFRRRQTGSANEGKPRKEAWKKWNLFRKEPSRNKKLAKKNLKQHLVKIKKLAIKTALQIYRPIRQFFYNIIHPEYSPVRDVYALMFLVDTINFIIIIFGYGAFGKYSAAADITESLSEDQVPQPFLVMLLLQFGMMIADRAIYLKRTMYGKCVFQVVLVFGIHFWMFFILPGVTDRRFNKNHVAQLWYLVKCIYFGLSAYQIKCGYPKHVLGNFLTKSYNCINLFLFQGFRMVPFLIELRAIMDWVWTDTTLSLSNWICVEDLYANIFIMKCLRESEKRYPQPAGQKKKMIVKYGMGTCLIFILICILWFPLLLMSLVKAVAGVVNQPLDISVKITISGYEPLFTMSAQQRNLIPFTQAAYMDLTTQYAFHPAAMQFIVNYSPEDIVTAKIKSNASLLWHISPASREIMTEELSKSTAVYVHVCWTVQRNASLVKNVEASGQYTVRYDEKEIREQIVQMLKGVRKEPILLPGLIPRYFRANAGVEAKTAHRLQVVHSHKPKDIEKMAFFRNVTIKLHQLPSNSSSSKATEWWIIQEQSPTCLNNVCSKNMELIVFNDKVSPPSLGFLEGYGVIGLYMSVVLVIGKFIREFFCGISRSIMFEELPNVDRILKLCRDIFLVRETGELELEEQLFAKLIFLYRSPETMIKWTKESN
ncbi:PREDICTED: piezo-type mechanosensitive ion channel component 2-like isoform X2 [Crocodylus porosus]|uniref:piezo-type mechanosensitive ion channel component 2-like isoform X2 n=1 Tax=Crocodylus porosus TaxID=8502 RepID=UPI00093ECAB5|nr:PREDICTED: piezo-type mechanosensitive ion channel component 2-like isoform X2 [Crocodylus porosus]